MGNGRKNNGPHYGTVENPLSFDGAYNFVTENPDNEYQTTGLGVEFTATATTAKKGKHVGEQVIIFKSYNAKKRLVERARAYECCWGHQTNCNRTYVDPYTPEIDD